MLTTAVAAETAALTGGPVRASGLAALVDVRAPTAKESTEVAEMTEQTASGHLAQFTGAGRLEEPALWL